MWGKDINNKNFILNFKNYIADLSLYRKFLFIFVFALCIESVVMMIVLGYLGKSYNKLLYEQTNEAMSYFSGNLERALKEVEELAAEMIADDVIQKELSQIKEIEIGNYEYSLSSDILEKQLLHKFYAQKNLITMSLVQDKRLITSIGQEASFGIYESLGFWEEGYNFENKEWICVPKDYSLLYIRRIREIDNLSLKELGYLIIRVDFKKVIEESINSKYRDEANYMLQIKSADEVIYNTQEELITDEKINDNHGYCIKDVSSRKMFIVHNTISRYAWDVIYGIPYNEIFDSVRSIWLVVIMVLLFDVILAAIICHKGISRILWHFTYLERKIEKFKLDRMSTFEPQVYDYRNRKDEIALIHCEFDDMTEQMNRLIQENYEKQIMLKDTRIKMLEQQMDPHFLYNTLQVIGWHAKLSDREKTVSIVNTLGSFLRNTLRDDGEKIALEQELQIIDDYIKLMKARYEDELLFEMHVDETCLGTTIPKMTLQPLVENAICYGLADGEDTVSVVINVYHQEENLYIDVLNTGEEIKEDILDLLKSGEIKPNGNGIGLRNIQERLQLIYGEEYGLAFSNCEHMTKVTVKIPFSEQEI